MVLNLMIAAAEVGAAENESYKFFGCMGIASALVFASKSLSPLTYRVQTSELPMEPLSQELEFHQWVF